MGKAHLRRCIHSFIFDFQSIVGVDVSAGAIAKMLVVALPIFPALSVAMTRTVMSYYLLIRLAGVRSVRSTS